jgi:hypothetical protein
MLARGLYETCILGFRANGDIRSALFAGNGLTGPPTILEGKLRCNRTAR